MSRGKYDPLRHPARPLVTHSPRLNLKNWGMIGLMIVGSNLATHLAFNAGPKTKEADLLTLTGKSLQEQEVSTGNDFYLAAKAGRYVYDLKGFGEKVGRLSFRLNIPEEWLLAVIYQESKFNPGVVNYQGSGAIGLIQFMPGTAAELGTTTYALQRMSASRQLDFVYQYLDKVRQRYGEYQSLTDLYLAILYPKARGADACYTLFASPARSYRQNSGLDEDKDKRITISDIDRHLKRKFPEAYLISKTP